MPRFSTDAIILQCIDFLESDKIVCALTRDRGVIHAIAKGAKRSKRRFPGTLEPFCEVRLDVFSKKGGDLLRLESANLSTANLAIREDLQILAHASVLIELVKEHLGELDPSPATYELLSAALAAMDPGVQWFSIWCISMINILASLGYGIDWKGNKAHAYKRRNNRLTDTLSMESRTFLIKGSRLDKKVLEKLSISRDLRREITMFLLTLCNEVSEKKLKSTGFLAKLLDLNMIQ
jgi:DNA repair protein RecO (recombination protein O)